MSVLETIRRIQHADPEKRVEFRSLPRKMKTEVIGFLKCQGMLAEELAATLNIPKSTVYYYWKLYTRELADFVRRNANQYIGRLHARAEHLYKSAKQKGDLALCWKIECDLMDKLIKIGLIDTVPAQVDVVLHDRRDPKIIEAELIADMNVLEDIKRAKRLALPAPGGNGAGAGGHPSDGGGGEISQDADERGD